MLLTFSSWSGVAKMIPLLLAFSLVINFGQVEPCNTNSLPTFVPGKCPRVTLIPEFNVTRYLGDWYAQRQTTSSFQPSGQVPKITICVKTRQLLSILIFSIL